jgi:hypothetical protein
MKSTAVSLVVLSATFLLPLASQSQSSAQRADAVAAWKQLPPGTLGCLRQNYNILPVWRYGIYPSDPSVARQVRICAERVGAVVAWKQLPPGTFGCLRRNYGIDPQVVARQYGIYPSDPSVARQVNICMGHPQAAPGEQKRYDGSGPGGPPGAANNPRSPAQGGGSSPQQLVMFQKGLADRTAWEKWFNGLSGDEKIGAFYWAGQRSLPNPGSCNQMSDAFQMGCREAVAMLSASDSLRKTDPAYKSGWNSYTAPDNEPATPPTTAAPPQEPPTPPPEQEVPATTASPVASARNEVPLVLLGDTYAVPTIVNESVKLDFTIDSGSSDITIPADVVFTLIRSGTLSNSDFIGDKIFTLADGRNLRSSEFTLHEVRIGNATVRNVVATVSPLESSPLLGQSLLSRFGSWTLNNNRHVLILGNGN